MAKTKSDAQMIAEGYEKVNGQWFKPGTPEYDLNKAREAEKAAKNQNVVDQVAAQAERTKAYMDGTDGHDTTKDPIVIQANREANKQIAADKAAEIAAKTPPDTFDTTLRELARARTQLQMAATNGQAGSAAGIGLGQKQGLGMTTGNKRLQPLGRTAPKDRIVASNQRPMSAFNLPFMNASRKVF